MKKILIVILVFLPSVIFATCGKYESCDTDCQQGGTPKTVESICQFEFKTEDPSGKPFTSIENGHCQEMGATKVAIIDNKYKKIPVTHLKCVAMPPSPYV